MTRGLRSLDGSGGLLTFPVQIVQTCRAYIYKHKGPVYGYDPCTNSADMCVCVCVYGYDP